MCRHILSLPFSACAGLPRQQPLEMRAGDGGVLLEGVGLDLSDPSTWQNWGRHGEGRGWPRDNGTWQSPWTPGHALVGKSVRLCFCSECHVASGTGHHSVTVFPTCSISSVCLPSCSSAQDGGLSTLPLTPHLWPLSLGSEGLSRWPIKRREASNTSRRPAW